MSEEYRRPSYIIRRTMRTQPDKIAAWSEAADTVEGMSFRVLDLTVPEQRSAAIGGFDAKPEVFKFGGEAIVKMAEQNGDGIVQLSGTTKQLGEFWNAVRASETEQ